MAEFVELLSIPNVGTDRANIRRNAEFIRAMLERHGMKPELLETAGNPLVYAEKNRPGATKTILFYIHYDGQPVDPAKWKQASPFHPDHARWPHGRRRDAHPWLRFARNLPRQLANLRALRLGRQSAHRCILRRARCGGRRHCAATSTW